MSKPIDTVTALKTCLDDTIFVLKEDLKERLDSMETEFIKGRLYQAKGIRKTIDTLVRGRKRLLKKEPA
jgi:hypothetical protein